jgi:hypothetical protein
VTSLVQVTSCVVFYKIVEFNTQTHTLKEKNLKLSHNKHSVFAEWGLFHCYIVTLTLFYVNMSLWNVHWQEKMPEEEQKCQQLGNDCWLLCDHSGDFSFRWEHYYY